jgi:hypothetical protein
MADELNKPSRGTGDWDIPLNQNFDTLEAAARAFLPRGTTQTLNVSDVNSDSVTNTGTITSESVNPQFLANDYLYAGSFPGSTPDDRLDAAISNAANEDMIFLEAAPYSNDRTITNRLKLMGTNRPGVGAGSGFGGVNLTIDDRVMFDGVRMTNSQVEVNAGRCSIVSAEVFSSNITVNGNRSQIRGIRGGSVTFASGTSNNLIDSCVQVSVTDNGSGNTVGDIS